MQGQDAVDSTPAHAAIHVKLLAQELLMRGFSERQVFGNSGINLKVLEDDKPVLAIGKIAAFYEAAAELTNDDLLGFKNGWSWNERPHTCAATCGRKHKLFKNT